MLFPLTDLPVANIVSGLNWSSGRGGNIQMLPPLNSGVEALRSEVKKIINRGVL